jgi:hypothetical protein
MMLCEGELRARFFKVGDASVGGKVRAVMSYLGGVDWLLILLAVCFCVLAAGAVVEANVMLREYCLDCVRVRRTRKFRR